MLEPTTSQLHHRVAEVRKSEIPHASVCVCVFVSHPLEELNEQPGVALHHVRLQVRQRDQLIEQLDEENMVLFTEHPSVQLQKPEDGGEDRLQ